MFNTDLILAILPVALINLGLVIWCLVDWAKRSRFRFFNKWVWLCVFLFFQFFGPAAYLIFGRDHDND
jgi:ABC-type maltose transport system permease subunit